MAGRLPAAVKTELAGRRDLAWLLDLSLPGGSVKWALDQTENSTARGVYEGRITRMGDLSTGVPFGGTSLETSRIAVEIEDTNLYFHKLVASVHRDVINGSVATIRLASRTDAAAVHTEFVGVLVDFNQKSPLRWELVLGRNDELLDGYVPKHGNGQSVWPHATPDVRATYGPLIYGTHDSKGSGGAVPCLLVDIPRSRWKVQTGWSKSVPRVYNQGTQLTSGFTIIHPLVAGYRQTLIEFSIPPGEDAEITCDVEGFETVGDGSGTLIENPSDQVKHYIVQFVYNDWKDGAYFADSTAPVDTTLFAALATYFTNHGVKGARRLAGGQRTGRDVFNEFCRSVFAHPFYTGPGKLAPRINDPASADVYIADPWFRLEQEVSLSGPSFPNADVIDRVDMQYLPDAVLDKYTQSLQVRDPVITKQAAESRDLPWSHGAV